MKIKEVFLTYEEWISSGFTRRDEIKLQFAGRKLLWGKLFSASPFPFVSFYP